MSYILEALKKSELARQEGAAALHYSLLPVVMEEDMVAARRWPYYVLGAGLVLNVAAFYFWPAGFPHLAARNEVAAAPPVPVAQVAPAPAVSKMEVIAPAATITSAATVPTPLPAPPVVAEAIAPPRQLKLAKPAPLDARVPAPVAVPAKIDRKPLRKEPELLSTAPAEPAAKAVTERTAKVAVAQDARPVPVANTEPASRTPAVQQPAVALPGDLPALSVGGFIREDGSSGMVVVNDRLVREGDEVMPGLTVEKIQNESVVFNYKGRRFVR